MATKAASEQLREAIEEAYSFIINLPEKITFNDGTVPGLFPKALAEKLKTVREKLASEGAAASDHHRGAHSDDPSDTESCFCNTGESAPATGLAPMPKEPHCPECLRPYEPAAQPSIEAEKAFDANELGAAMVRIGHLVSIQRTQVKVELQRAFAAGAASKPSVKSVEELRQKVQTWANNCAVYEKEHSWTIGTNAAQEYHRGGKEAYQRVVDEVLSQVALPKVTEEIIHGINCPKAAHTRTGYLHDESDDAPYWVDGCKYCGRCHVALQ